ncbi:hypothetical protein AGLY_000383 [Aphis glycines]|uniref:Uncharacterized protein n=1 Tax=Aphis glycines TaxID=307491 RepID=A0A6G0U6U4_APHGL|nr:hypothetical protein AGLY_000383 [Aphis glycines]
MHYIAFRCGNATVTVGIDSSEVVTTQAGLVKSVLGASLYDGCLEGCVYCDNKYESWGGKLLVVAFNLFCDFCFFLLCLLVTNKKSAESVSCDSDDKTSSLCSVDANFLEDWFCFGTFFLLFLLLLIDFDSSSELSIDTSSTLLYLVIFILPFFGLPQSSSEPFPFRLLILFLVLLPLFFLLSLLLSPMNFKISSIFFITICNPRLSETLYLNIFKINKNTLLHTAMIGIKCLSRQNNVIENFYTTQLKCDIFKNNS